MTEMSRKWWLVVVFLLAAGGCSSSSPNWGENGDGSVVKTDAGGDAASPSDGALPGSDATAGEDAQAPPDAEPPDGLVTDGGSINAPPVVEITDPASGVGRRDSITVTFKATDADDGLAASAPEIAIDGRVLTGLGLAAPAAGAHDYTATATYTISAPPAADSLAGGAHTLTVKVADVAGQIGMASLAFMVDRSGPVITPASPLEGQMVGGTIVLSAKVEDSSGINDASVTVELREIGSTGPAAVTLSLLRVDGDAKSGTFAFSYDTGRLPTNMVWPQIMWRAGDLLGNASTLSYQFSVDNTPPVASLTSGLFILRRKIGCWTVCGDGKCESPETMQNCPKDCGAPDCTDTTCDVGETNATCPNGCAPGCGDGVCSPGERCPADCGTCGDGICDDSPPRNESCATCPEDCGQCRGDCDADNQLHACSVPVDPLANWQRAENLDGVNPRAGAYVQTADQTVVPQAMFMRARIEDLSNHVTGQEQFPGSLVDKSRVWLYVLPRDDRSLVVADAGGNCSRINPALHEVGAIGELSDPDDVLALNMVPVPPVCDPDFTPWKQTKTAPLAGHFDPEPPYWSFPSGLEFCDALGDPAVTQTPDPRCQNLAAYAQSRCVMHVAGLKSEPAIYTLAPVADAAGPMCEGIQFDAVQLPEGWFCAAVVAYDNVGNMGVSQPLQLCVNKNWSSPSACDTPPTRSCVQDLAGTAIASCKVGGYDDPYPLEFADLDHWN